LIFARRVLHSYAALRYLQLLAMMVALALWGKLAVREFGRFVAACLFVFIFFCPIPSFYASVLYPYSFQFFLVTLGIYLLIDGVRGGGIWTWIGAGAAFGIASYERGAYLLLPVFLAVAIVFSRKRFGSLAPVLRGEGGGEGSDDERRKQRDLRSHPSPPPSPLRAWELIEKSAPKAAFSREKPRQECKNSHALSTGERGPERTTARRVGLFVLIALAVCLPWLLRNRSLGAGGMNQMTGYALGYAYGDLPAEPRDVFERGYDRSVAEFGTDSGTIKYIQEQVVAGSGSFAAVDRRIAGYVARKCSSHPDAVLRRFGWSLVAFPYRLCDVSLGHLRTPDRVAAHYWRAYANALPITGDDDHWPAPMDLVIMGLALVGMRFIVREKPAVGMVMGALLLYTVLFSTTIVRFDPRYRGAADPVLFIAAGVAMSRIASVAWRSFAGKSGCGHTP
jgi:hypothetical protein